MNDRYLFRGKRLDNGEWVEGHYVHEDNKHGICYNPYDGIKAVRWVEIDPATLGQCTGLKDKNGRLIFEGDVLGAVNNKLKFIVEIGKCELDFGIYGFSHSMAFHGCYLRSLNNSKRYEKSRGMYSELVDTDRYEIIGNVHDSPELLEAKAS